MSTLNKYNISNMNLEKELDEETLKVTFTLLEYRRVERPLGNMRAEKGMSSKSANDVIT